ncbi:MAG: AAA family ATPase [Proteobacteria bacterium]|nr:AAA family ATPase [Pseudomonadota bacterium]
MYLDLFRLKELPFRLSPDPQFLYLSKHHSRAKAYMESTIWFTDGFVVITGEIGSGKTTLIESFLRELDREVVVAQINQTQITPIGFLQGLLVQFGFSPFKMNKAELLSTVNSFLIEQYAAGRKVVLVIDEAQNLSNRVLEEVRLLSGVETTKDKTLRIILAGQPELNDKLDAPEMRQLAQRIRLRFHLTPLSKEDTTAYVLHRLEVAGSGGRAIFTDAALALLYRYTGGVPRLINTLCDTSMMSAYAIDKDTVDEAEVKTAIEELQWVEYAGRTNRMPRTEMVVPVLRSVHADAVLGRLLVATDGRTIGDKPLKIGRLLVGRTPENDLQIDSQYVSRHHCQVTVALEGVVIEDLNSTNGIVCRGRRVRRQLLNDGDVIVIGRHTLTYVDERPGTLRHVADSTAGDQSPTGSQETLAGAAETGNGPH